jgi:hypothetical protein
LREDGSPYYIGKGKGNRAYDTNHTVRPPKNKNLIVFLERNLSNIGALALERRYIRWYGRKDISTGILRNRTDGGDGVQGHVVGKEQRRKMSLAKKGKPGNKLGSKLSTESRQRLSDAHKGNTNRRGKLASPQTKEKMSVAQQKLPIKTCPHCGKQSRSNGIFTHIKFCHLKLIQ